MIRFIQQLCELIWLGVEPSSLCPREFRQHLTALAQTTDYTNVEADGRQALQDRRKSANTQMTHAETILLGSTGIQTGTRNVKITLIPGKVPHESFQ